MWFLIAFSFDCGTGWIAAMISIIGYSTFCCCQPNDAGLKCMLQTVIVSGVFRFISFCMLCAYLGNINDWDHSCVLAKTDCYNNGITYSDGLTNCHHHKSGCGKNKDDDAYCPNTLGLYSAKFEICTSLLMRCYSGNIRRSNRPLFYFFFCWPRHYSSPKFKTNMEGGRMRRTTTPSIHTWLQSIRPTAAHTPRSISRPGKSRGMVPLHRFWSTPSFSLWGKLLSARVV